MARPMLLIREDVLSDMWAKHQDGVPISALIRNEQLDITNPTLTVLLAHMTAMENAERNRQDEVYDIIYASLFPEWLTAGETDEEDGPAVVRQPKTWFYAGKMPLGKWVKR